RADARVSDVRSDRTREQGIVVYPRRAPSVANGGRDTRTVDRPIAPDGEGRLVERRENRRCAIGLIASQDHGRDVENEGRLADDRRIEVDRGRTLRYERCEAPQGGLLLREQFHIGTRCTVHERLCISPRYT